MNTTLPKAGQYLTLEIAGSDGRRYVYEAAVVSAEAAKVQVTLPPGAQLPSTPSVGSTVVARFLTPQGRRTFSAFVLAARLEEVFHLSLEPIDETHQLQRRRYARVAVEVPFSLRLLDEETPSEEVSAQTLDLGGKGAGVLADRPLPVGRKLDFVFELGKTRCAGTGTIVDSVEVLGDKGTQHRTCIEFSEVSIPVLAYVREKVGWAELKAGELC